MLEAWINSNYDLVRRSPIIYEGVVPATTQTIAHTFEDLSTIGIIARGISLPLTVSIIGDVSEVIPVTIDNRYVEGSLEFTNTLTFSTTVVSSGGYLELRAVRSDGSGSEFDRVIESGRAYFTLQSSPTAILDAGRIIRGEAALFKLEGEVATEDDLIHIVEDDRTPVGATYSVMRARRMKTVQSETVHRLDLVRRGREVLGNAPF